MAINQFVSKAVPEANPGRFDCGTRTALKGPRPLSAEPFQRFQFCDARQVFAGVGRSWLPPCGVHRRRTKTNRISGETVLSPLLADLRSPPASTTCFCSATFCAFARFTDLLSSLARSSALPCRCAKGSGIPKTLWLARGSRTDLKRWPLLCL
jgi:hypothetical protein